jgi:DNA-binding CsgD family transcriptional regulator
VRKASDFVTLREFRRREIWQELYRPTGLDYWLDVGLPRIAERTRVFIFMRDRCDFDEHDRLVLELLQPHLARRHEATRLAAETAVALTAVEEQRDGGTTDVVLCTPRGVIEFASARSRRLLEAYFGPCSGRVPSPLLGALAASARPASAERAGRRLLVRAARAGPLLLLVLSEQDTRLERLTPRQRQILERVALGETDGEIAAALSLSQATVGKHLEQMFTRLGVHTRTAAAAVLCAPPER